MEADIAIAEEPESPPMDEALCPHCLHPNTPTAYFCIECHTPMRTVTEIDPIGRIHAQADTYLKATRCCPSRIVLIGMWMLCLPSVATTVIFLGYMIYALSTQGLPPLGQALGFSISAAMFLSPGVVFGILLYRATRNYFTHIEPEAIGDGSGESAEEKHNPPNSDEF